MAQNLPPNEAVEQAPRERRASSVMWIGLALLIAGAFMLADNLGFPVFNLFRGDFDWWALFLLVPGAIVLKNAYDAYKASGDQFNRTTRTQLLTGAVLVIFALMFLFNISMSMFLPIALLFVGGLLLFNALT